MTDNIDENEATLLEAMSIEDQPLDFKALSGKSLANAKDLATKEQIINAIREVSDPEIPINVYDMGLIYNIDQKENGDVFIDMTLTAPACPVAGVLPQEVANAVSQLEGVGVVEVKLVWEPQWTIDRLTDEAKAMLDIF